MRRILTEEGGALAVRAIEGDDEARAQIYADAPGVSADADAPETLREALQGFAQGVATWTARALAHAALSRLEQTAFAHRALLLSLRDAGVGDPEQIAAWAQEVADLEAAARKDLERLAQRGPEWRCDRCGAGFGLPMGRPDERVGAVEVGRALHAAGLVLVPSGGLDDPAPQLCAGCRGVDEGRGDDDE